MSVLGKVVGIGLLPLVLCGCGLQFGFGVPVTNEGGSSGGAPRLAGFAVVPADVVAGNSVGLQVTLDRPAPAGGTTVGFAVTTNHGLTDSLKDRPVSLTIPAGQSAGTAYIRTQRYAGNTLTVPATHLIEAATASNKLYANLSIN